MKLWKDSAGNELHVHFELRERPVRIAYIVAIGAVAVGFFGWSVLVPMIAALIDIPIQPVK